MSEEEKKKREQQTETVQTPEVPANLGQSQIPIPANNAPVIDAAALRQQADQLVQRDEISHVDTSGMEKSIDRQYAAAEEQARNQIDYATQQSINELAKAREEGQEQYQTQYNQIDRDEARARDNQALYSAARGDRGGIGAAQYDAVANTAAANRQTVRTAQTKFAVDIMRQMAELRAQGEYEKANSALQIMQAKLSELRNLQLTALQMNLSIDQFNAQMQQWAYSYVLEVQQANIAASQWMAQMAYQRERDQRADYESDRAYQYQLGRDEINDARYADETNYNRSIDERNYNYQLNRDRISDTRYMDERNYNRTRDAVSDARYVDETNYNRSQAEQNTARNNVYNKLQMGIMPTSNELSAAGVSADEARRYVNNVNITNESAARVAETNAKNATQQSANTETGGTNNANGNIEDFAFAALLDGTSYPQQWVSEHYKNYGFNSKPTAKEFELAMNNVKKAVSRGERLDLIGDFDITNKEYAGGYYNVTNSKGNVERVGLSRILDGAKRGIYTIDVDYKNKKITFRRLGGDSN